MGIRVRHQEHHGKHVHYDHPVNSVCLEGFSLEDVLVVDVAPVQVLQQFSEAHLVILFEKNNYSLEYNHLSGSLEKTS